MVFSEKAVSSQGWLRTFLIIASLMSEPTVLPSTDQATLKHCSKYQILKIPDLEVQQRGMPGGILEADPQEACDVVC